MSTPKGWPTQEKDQRLIPQFATVEPVHTLQHGLSVLAHQYVAEIGTDAAEAGSSTTAIVATAHNVQAGDVIRITSGALSGREIKVYSVSSNLITLAEELPSAIADGVTFQILRHKYPLVEPTGEVKISGSFTSSEEAVAADGGALPAKVKVAGGYDGSAVQVLKTDVDGELQIDVLSSALPSGAATSALQNTANSALSSIDGKIPASLTVSSTRLLVDGSGVTQPVSGSVSVSNFPGTQAVSGPLTDVELRASAVPVSAASLPLPAGAATSAAQTDGTQKSQIVDAAGDIADVKLLSVNLAGTDKGLVTNTIIHGETTGGGGGYVDVKVTPSGALTTESTLAGLDASVLGQDTMANSLPVVIASNQSAIPISGSITVSDAANGTVGASVPTTANLSGGSDGSALRALKTDSNGELQVDVLSSALPTGAATADNQTNGNQRVNIVGVGSNNVGAALPFDPYSSITSYGLNTRAILYGRSVSGGEPSVIRTTDSLGRLSVDINSMPSGSATETTLSAINTKVPAQGQALMAASTPVVIASNQTAIPVSGTVTATNAANGNTGAAVPVQATLVGGTDGTNLRGIKTDANGELQIDVLSSALPAGAATETTLSALNGKVTACDTGSVTIASSALPTGAATETTLSALNGKVTACNTGNVTIASSALPTGAATETTLSALNGKVTACDTGSVTIASSALPAGAATETTLSALNTKMPSQGQALMAASVPVVIASNQTAIPVSGSFTAGTLSVVDLLDANILDTSVTNIPGSASSPVQVIASTAAEIKAIQLLDTTGAFVGVYVGGIGSEVLKFVMGPGSDQTIEHNIPAASRVSLKRLDSTAAVSSGIVAMNCMG